jgi:hypothetical protein
MPGLGSAPRNPVWIRTAKGRLEVITDIALLAYTVMMAWNVAKILNPPLQVKQDQLVYQAKMIILSYRKTSGELPGLTVEESSQLFNDIRKFTDKSDA